MIWLILGYGVSLLFWLWCIDELATLQEGEELSRLTKAGISVIGPAWIFGFPVIPFIGNENTNPATACLYAVCLIASWCMVYRIAKASSKRNV